MKYHFRSVVLVVLLGWRTMETAAFPATTTTPSPPRSHVPVVVVFPHRRVSFLPTVTHHIMTTLQSSSSSDHDNDDSTTTTTSRRSDGSTLPTRADCETRMSDCVVLLQTAADTKQVDPDSVYQALTTLEQLARQCNRLRDDDNDDDHQEYAYAQSVQHNLTGSWRLIFTTGTAQTQSQLLGGAKINYFPIKAVQSFNTSTNVITNAIYVGDFVLLQFRGTFDFDVRKCQLTFDFDEISLFHHLVTIPLPHGQAAELGAASGLGSASNVVNIKAKKKKAFFNWISANDQIATARGGGGGLALWKRI